MLSNYIILIGIAAFMLMALFIISFVMMYQNKKIKHQFEIQKINRRQQKELIQAAIHSEEEERKRIAGELHDDIGATLSSIKLYLTKAEQTADNIRFITQSKKLLDESIEKVRQVSHKIQPLTIQKLGLSKALMGFADVLNGTQKIEMKIESTADIETLSEHYQLSIYRIVQELCNNIIKHSTGSRILLRTENSNGFLLLTMTHDGKGLTNEDYEKYTYTQGTTGLKNIVSRLKSMNAISDFCINVTGLYEIHLRIPLSINQTT